MIVFALIGWLVAAVLAVVVWQLDMQLEQMKRDRIAGSREFTDEPMVEADLPDHATFRVMQLTPDGRRARMIFERGQPGPGEALHLYDGPHLRGQKQGPTTTP